MPNLLTGDRLVVTKYPYGWSYVSPTIPNPAAILRNLVLRHGEPWTVTLPFMEGRLLGIVPERGDVVIVTPPGGNQDYIKRVIGLPGDTVEVRGGRLILTAGRSHHRSGRRSTSGRRQRACTINHSTTGWSTPSAASSAACPSSARRCPTGHTTRSTMSTAPTATATGRRRSAGARLPDGDTATTAPTAGSASRTGLGGPVPVENIGGRAEFITFSLDGTTMLTDPSTWFSAFREGRAGHLAHAEPGVGAADGRRSEPTARSNGPPLRHLRRHRRPRGAQGSGVIGMALLAAGLIVRPSRSC